MTDIEFIKRACGVMLVLLVIDTSILVSLFIVATKVITERRK